MRGLIARIFAGQAPLPAEDGTSVIQAQIAAGIAQQREQRLARERRRASQRFEHARPKLEQLRAFVAERRRAENGQ